MAIEEEEQRRGFCRFFFFVLLASLDTDGDAAGAEELGGRLGIKIHMYSVKCYPVHWNKVLRANSASDVNGLVAVTGPCR